MRIAQINMLPNGSTGSIMQQIALEARKNGHLVKTFSSAFYDIADVALPEEEHMVFGSRFENRLHVYLGVATGGNGMFSHMGTHELINDLKRFQPDIVHLHNLHRFCINLPMIFSYIRKNNIKLIWTLHDCWAFTGKCPHYLMTGCDKWLSGCGNCPQLNGYPKSAVDSTRAMYEKKRKIFTSIENMTIVTPSEWLAKQVEKSFLGEYETRVIHNGTDLDIFKPTDSSFKSEISCDGKKIVLGVAFDWGERKGLDVFNALAAQLDESYRIVLVGVTEAVKDSVSDKIITIQRTESPQKLAEIYTAADVFVNPTREEVFGLVNIEALGCGTPVITFNAGGSPETIDESCGYVVDTDDISAMKEKIEYVVENKPFSKDDCIKRAAEFNKADKFKEYVRLYEDSAHSPHSTL